MDTVVDTVHILTANGWKPLPHPTASTSLDIIQEQLIPKILQYGDLCMKEPFEKTLSIRLYANHGERERDRIEVISPICYRLTRHCVVFPVVQYSHVTNNVRIIFYGMASTRNYDRGVGRILSEVKLDEILEEVCSLHILKLVANRVISSPFQTKVKECIVNHTFTNTYVHTP